MWLQDSLARGYKYFGKQKVMGPPRVNATERQRAAPFAAAVQGLTTNEERRRTHEALAAERWQLQSSDEVGDDAKKSVSREAPVRG